MSQNRIEKFVDRRKQFAFAADWGEESAACPHAPTMITIHEGWESNVSVLLTKMAKDVSERTAFAARMLSIEQRLIRIESTTSISACISALGETEIELIQPIPFVIRFNGDDFIASFFDANVHASGETRQEAFDGMREMLIATFTFPFKTF
jgi:hypothetical protein